MERKWKILNKAHDEIDGGKLSLFMVQNGEAETMDLFDFGHSQFGGFQNAILANTWSNSLISDVWMNCTWWSKFHENGSCWSFYLPMQMVSSDQMTCFQEKVKQVCELFLMKNFI
jgi:hypothetical protein